MSAINDITESWAGHSGLEVETWLKNIITSNISSMGGKIGDVVLAGSSLVFYDEPGGTVLKTISLSGDVYNIAIDCNLDQVFYVLSDEPVKQMTIAPSTTVSPFGSQESQTFPEAYSYVVSINNGGGYIPRATGNIASGGSATINLRPYLSTGDNFIRVVVTGESSGQVRTMVLTGTLTTLTMSVNHAWQTVWNEGDNYIITGIRFAGSLVKTLHVAVNNVEQTPITYTANQSYTTTATTYTIPSSAFPANNGNDVYEIKLWMTAQGVNTPEIKYYIMCVANNDNTPLVTINNITSQAVNWTTSRLFSYAVYNADKASFDLSATLGNVTYPIVSDFELPGLVDGQMYDFNYSIEVDTGINEEPSGTLYIDSTSFYGNIQGDGIAVNTGFDNTYSYLATPGALFYMNASVRSNNESTKELIKNEMGASADGRFAASYNGEWTNFGWNGDGWDADSDGHRALKIPAGSSLIVPELAPLKLMTNYPDGMTFEVMIKNEYPANYDTPILTISDISGSSNGISIYPTKIVVLGTYERSLVNQTVNISENRMTHITITFVKGYEGINGRNLVSIYVNGISNINFAFDASTSFGTDCLRIGQSDTDIFIYRMRIYGFALDSQSVFNNFLNSIIDGVEFNRNERSHKNDLFEGSQIDYDKVKAAGFNTMVIKMTNDATLLPSVDHPAPDDGYPNCSLRFEYADNFNKNVTISNVSIDGQGTTSKKYYRWNIRAKTKSNTGWTYGDGTEEVGKKGHMINDPNYIKVDRITAKKNYASSMQGHKMGMTNIYNDLFKQCGLGGHLPSSDYRVAVYQFPFVGFRYYESNDSYEFIGIYTVGPDKGSKPTFGYSDSYMSLLSLEGPNHAPRGTRFLHPWCDITYDPEQETLCFGGEEGWDCDYVNYESSTSGTQADWDAIMSLYETEWRPAYECVYNNSPYIASLAEVIAAVNDPSITTLEDVLDPNNAELITGTTINGYLVPIGVMEFYDTEYERYFFRTKTGRFERIVDVDNTLEHNVLTDIHDYLTTLTPNTSQIIAARALRFKDLVSSYWDVDQALFHYAFCELFAVSDNFAKNSYPFKFLPFTASGAKARWGWRQDDMDTVLMTDNNGNNTKSYSVEPGDTYDGVQIFQGYNSALWVLIHDNYSDEIRTMMNLIVTSASELATTLHISGDGLHDSLFNLVSHYCWEQSAKYFSETLYENDRRWSYIQPWLENPTKEYNSVLPLTQSLGDQYQAERLWIERRIAYIFSKYRIGAFNGATEGYGEIAFTLAQQFTFNLTPAIDLYPTASTGSTTIRGSRTESGNTTQITLTTTGDTTNYIKGGTWLASLGDLSNMVMTARGGGDISFSVVCPRLLSLKVGDENSANVGFNADSFSVVSPSIKYIDARNTSTIRNIVNLMNCPRLQTVLFDGSGASGMLLPVGAKVTEVSFPDEARVLFLHSLPSLDNDHLTLPDLTEINTAYIYNCDNLNGFTILSQILNEPNNMLHYATAVWQNVLKSDENSLSILDKLTRLDGSVVYENGAIQNILGTPYIEGVLDITDISGITAIPLSLNVSLNETYGNYKRLWISNFSNRLSIIYKEENLFPIGYVDDGRLWIWVNITSEGDYNVTATKSWTDLEVDGITGYTNRSVHLTEGEHLLKFTLIDNTTININTFNGEEFYTKICLPNTVTTITSFRALGTAEQPVKVYMDKSKIISLGDGGCFWHSYADLGTFDFPNLEVFGGAGSYYGGYLIPSIKNLGKITTIPDGAFSGFCPADHTYLIPETVTSIGTNAFTSVDRWDLIVYCYPPIPPTLGSGNFSWRPPTVFYVPFMCGDRYKEASGWSSFASRFEEMLPFDDGYIWAVYDVTDTENATTLLNNTYGLDGTMSVDYEEEITATTTYLFETTGLHLVKFKATGSSLDGNNNSPFRNIPTLIECYIPSNIHTYGNYCFDSCSNLRKIYCYGDVTSITDYYCFMRSPIEEFNFEKWKVNSTGNSGNFTNHKLRGTIEIPEGVTTPPSFSGANIDGLSDLYITLPSTTNTLLGYFCQNCKNLVTLTCKATIPPTASYDMFVNCSNLTTIYVPSESVNLYKSASQWSQHASKIQAIVDE